MYKGPAHYAIVKSCFQYMFYWNAHALKPSFVKDLNLLLYSSHEWDYHSRQVLQADYKTLQEEEDLQDTYLKRRAQTMD